MTNSTDKPDTHSDSPAFVMEDGDRLYSVLVSHGVTFESSPGIETVLTFFVIRRASGKYSIAHIIKTYDKSKCISRKAQVKNDISEKRLDMELKGIKAVFTQAIEQKSGVKLEWDVLDLSGIVDMKEQVLRIQQWGRVSATIAGGISDISLN
jgi:hypothetical protein